MRAILLALFYSSFAMAGTQVCNKLPPGLVLSQNDTVRSECYGNGKLAKLEYLFDDRKRVSIRYTFNESEKLSKFETFSGEQALVQSADYTYEKDNIYSFKREIELEKKKVALLSYVAITFRPRFKETVVQKKYFRAGQIFLEEYFNSQSALIDRVIFHENDSSLYDYKVSAENSVKNSTIINTFSVRDGRGIRIGSYARHGQMPDAAPTFNKRPVVIIDSGLDITHEDLKNKLYTDSKNYPYFSSFKSGWFFEPFTGKNSNYILDELFYQLGRYPYVPFSHGTHVSSLAIKDIKDFGLVMFAGDYSEVSFLNNINKWFQENSVLFANMSFGFGDRENPFGAGSASRDALVGLMRENARTLFFVAAGNDGQDLDSSDKDDVPPKAPVDNKLVIAALDTDEIKEDDFEKYKLTSFSNYGSKTVDLAAAGDDVYGANIGNTHIRVSGTSMASPNALNAALRISEINPDLTALQVKEILMRTAYVPKKPLPVVSKGILFRRKALFVAEQMKKGLSLDQSIKLFKN